MDWRDLMEPLIDPVEELAEAAADLEEMRAGLADLAEETKTGELAEKLARASFVERATARAEAPAGGVVAARALDPGLPPEEAIRYLRAKGYAIGFDWRDVWREEHFTAFTVAKVADLDLLADIRAGVDKALAEGTTLREFRRELEPLLKKKGWWGRKSVVDPLTGESVEAQLGSPQRLETIFRTNLRTAYANGHWDSIQRTKSRLPYLRYTAVMDERTRPEHAAWHGTILPVDDAWWETHTPPNGWNCRCRLIPLSETQMRRAGWQVSSRPSSPTRPVVNKRTGEVAQVPVGIDLGWDYNPGNGAARRAEVSRLFAERLETAFPGEGAGKIYEWDPAKRKASRKKHGVDFASMVYFDWGTAEDAGSEVEDGETRENAFGLINGRLHRVTYTERDGKMRMISLRKADKREARRYAKKKGLQ